MLQFKDKIGGVMEISFQKERREIYKKVERFAEGLKNELRQKVYEILYPLIGRKITFYGPRLPGDDYLSGTLLNLGLEVAAIKIDNGVEIEIPYDDIDKIFI